MTKLKVMKLFFIVILTAMSASLSGQQLDSCGLNNDSRINKYESDFLNSYLKETRNSFDFSGRKIAFVTNKTAGRIVTKTEYFKEVKTMDSSNSRVPSSLFILTESEKMESGGYDAVVTYWVKLLTDKRRKKIVKELKAFH